MIPKIIYVFWEGEITVLVKACFNNIKRMNPGFEVKLLTSESIGQKPKNYDNFDKVQHKSDWARIEAISKTGGVWIDISSIVLKPFDSWIDFDSDTFHGFYAPWGNDVIENWAFAAPKGCPLIEAWKKEFKKAFDIGFRTYNKENDKPECLKRKLPYLTMHQALHIARIKVPDKKLKIMKSEDKNMPLDIIIAKCDLKAKCVVDIMKEKHLDHIFIKLSGWIRNYIKSIGCREMTLFERIFQHRYSHVERTLRVCIGKKEKDSLLLKIILILISILILILLINDPPYYLCFLGRRYG